MKDSVEMDFVYLLHLGAQPIIRLWEGRLGGAIIHPSLPSIQLAEMASINNRVFRTVGSPLILPEHHTLVLKPVNSFDFHVTLDHLTVMQQ